VPAPCPLAAPVIRSHGVSVFTVHAQSLVVATVNSPDVADPDAAPCIELSTAMSHFTVDGPVSLVEFEPEHAEIPSISANKVIDARMVRASAAIRLPR
jgi:hypothetical protein